LATGWDAAERRPERTAERDSEHNRKTVQKDIGVPFTIHNVPFEKRLPKPSIEV
jgi:hypothetical protein